MLPPSGQTHRRKFTWTEFCLHSIAHIKPQIYIEPRIGSVTSGTLRATPKGVVTWQYNYGCHTQPPAYSRDADKPAYHNFNPRQIDGTDKWLNVVAGVGCYTCLRTTTVYTCSENTCVCVILTHVGRMNTVFLITEPSWRQAVRFKPTGASCRCCQPSASTPRAKEIGCLLASSWEGKENIYQGNHSKWIFDYKPTLLQGVRPLGSVWVSCLLSVLPVERFNHLSNMAEIKTPRCLYSTAISLHCPMALGCRKTKQQLSYIYQRTEKSTKAQTWLLPYWPIQSICYYYE